MDILSGYISSSFPRPEGRNEPDWASKIHIATYPADYHSYLMGLLLASQFTDAMGRSALGVDDPYNVSFANDPRIGEYFIEEIYSPGSLYSWSELVERATGEKLTSAFYAKQYVGEK